MKQYIKELSQVSTLGLSHKAYTEKIQNENSFYQLALHNGLIGIMYHSIQKDQVSTTLHDRLTKDYYTYISSDMKYHQAIKKINQLLNEHRIDHIFLKGSILKDLYPESYMRIMGDIDILIHDKDYTRVQKVFKEHDILLSQKSSSNELYIMHQEISVEIHRKIDKDSHASINDFLAKPWDYAQQKNLFEFRLRPEFELIYLLHHLSKHLKSSGIGMRSVLDISIYLKSFEHEIDFPLLKDMLNKTGLSPLFTHILKVNELFFGIQVNQQFLTSELLTQERYLEMIDYMVHSGINITNNDILKIDDIHAPNTLKTKSFPLLILHVLFPKYKDMASQYNVLKTWKVLLPILWIYRWFHFTYLGLKKFIQQFFNSKKSTYAHRIDQKILEDLGL
jgi:hypothetical protein